MEKKSEALTKAKIFSILAVILVCIAVVFAFVETAAPISDIGPDCSSSLRYYLPEDSYTVGEYLWEVVTGPIFVSPMDYYTVDVQTADGGSTLMAVAVNKLTSASFAQGKPVTIYGRLVSYPSSALNDSRDWELACLRQEAGYLPVLIAIWCALTMLCGGYAFANFLYARDPE